MEFDYILSLILIIICLPVLLVLYVICAIAGLLFALSIKLGFYDKHLEDL